MPSIWVSLGLDFVHRPQFRTCFHKQWFRQSVSLTIWLRSRLQAQHGAYDVSNTLIAKNLRGQTWQRIWQIRYLITKFRMENYYLQISSKKLSILHSLHFRGLAIKIESRHIRVPSQWWHYLKSDMRLWRIVLCRHCTERCYINWLEAAARHITRFTAADYRLQRKNFFLLVSISFLCKKIVLRSWVLKQMQKIYWN